MTEAQLPTINTLSAAHLLLRQMGITAADLITEPHPAPTFAQIVPELRTTLSAGTRRTYGTHLAWLETHSGHRRLDEISPAEFDDAALEIKATSRINRASRDGGTGAVEHLPSAAYTSSRPGCRSMSDLPSRTPPAQMGAGVTCSFPSATIGCLTAR